MRKIILLSIAAATAIFAQYSQGAISVSSAGFFYNQSFDGLSNTGTSNAWTNDSTIPGWNLFNGAGTAIAAYRAENGSTNSGSFYSFGTTGSNERALGGTASGGAYFGSPASGAVAGFIAVSFANNSGATLDKINVAYDGEQWRNGGNTSAQTMVAEYGFGATFATVATWTAAGASWNFTSPVTGSTAAAVDGNVAGKVTGLGGSLTGLTWADGESLWVRWIERNDTGNDHGLAIDNFKVSIPEPSTALLGLGALGLAVRRRRA